MTAHASTSLPLPDQHDYRCAADTLHDAHAALESIEWRLRAIAHGHGNDDELDELEQPPSLADVGALWAFIDDVERVIGQLATKRDELRRELGTLNLMRLDGVASGRPTHPGEKQD